MVDDARHHEEQVGQAVDVAEQHGIDRRLRAPPSAARRGGRRSAPRAARRRPGAAGEDEPAQRRQFGLEPIDRAARAGDVGVGDHRLRDAGRELVRRIGQLGAEREQVALNPDERLVQVGVEARGAREAEPGVQLVDFAVRVDAARRPC